MEVASQRREVLPVLPPNVARAITPTMKLHPPLQLQQRRRPPPPPLPQFPPVYSRIPSCTNSGPHDKRPNKNSSKDRVRIPTSPTNKMTIRGNHPKIPMWRFPIRSVRMRSCGRPIGIRGVKCVWDDCLKIWMPWRGTLLFFMPVVVAIVTTTILLL